MTNLSIEYLGLNLKTPIIVSSSPLTASVEKIALIERHGAGAVVLKSIFEEQIEDEAAMLERYSDYPEAADYLHAYLSNDYMREYIELIEGCKKRLTIPIIASINCSNSGNWIDYARRIEKAGADAVELNIFILPTDAEQSSEQIETQYLEIVGCVTQAVTIPVSVKLSSRFTNVLNMARNIYCRKARGVVMFNRYFEPDIDIENMMLTSSDFISSPSELRNVLRYTALCSASEPQLDLAVSTGVHSGHDAVKALLAGANAVQICSVIYNDGLDAIGNINKFISDWMDRNGYQTIEQFRGEMNYKDISDHEIYQRVQFMRYFPG